MTPELHVDESDFEGTLVLECMARIDRLEEFMDAVDDDDLRRAGSLMQEAGLDEATIGIVLKKMAQQDSEH